MSHIITIVFSFFLLSPVGGRNINDLTSASDDVLSSDTNKSPQKPTPPPPTSQDRQVAWSKGIENLIKATSQNHNDIRYVPYAKIMVKNFC